MTEEANQIESSETTPESSVDAIEVCPFQAEDRVKRKDGEGCFGIVHEVRSEVTATSGDSSERGLLVIVNWDNGTTSYLTPASLEKAS